MKHVDLPLIELLGIAATRGMLGAGLALLVSDKLSRAHCRLIGGVLAAIGIVTTVPFAYDVLRHRAIPPQEM